MPLSGRQGNLLTIWHIRATYICVFVASRNSELKKSIKELNAHQDTKSYDSWQCSCSKSELSNKKTKASKNPNKLKPNNKRRQWNTPKKSLQQVQNKQIDWQFWKKFKKKDSISRLLEQVKWIPLVYTYTYVTWTFISSCVRFEIQSWIQETLKLINSSQNYLKQLYVFQKNQNFST